MYSTPTALPPALPTELLTYILTQQSRPITILICQSRATFLSSLCKAISHTFQSPVPEDAEAEDPEPAQLHPLLIPTLHQIATSRDTHLVFVHTVTHLRAWLAAFPDAGLKRRDIDVGNNRRGVLVMYGVLGLHKDTSEWSAQGIGNSLSSAVEAGVRSGRKVALLEERRLGDEEEGMDLDNGQGVQKEKVVWEEPVPMLNGSVRREGLDSEEGGWSGRTVEVGRIVARWFKFRKGDWAEHA